LILAGWKWG